MEQQTEQSINQPEPNTEVQPKPIGISATIAGFILLLLIVGGGWYLLKNENDNVMEDQREDTTLQTPSEMKIEWNTLEKDSRPIRTTRSLPYFNEYVLVFKVGEIKTGEYKDRLIVLGVPQGPYNAFERNNQDVLYYYHLFISDEYGNAIVWDKRFLHDPDDRCLNLENIQGCEYFYSIKEALGLTNDIQKTLNFIPKEIGNARYIDTTNKGAVLRFFWSNSLNSIDTLSKNSQVVDQTKSGLQIVRDPSDVLDTTIIPNVSYFLILPFGKMAELITEPDFIDENDIPQLTWKIGASEVASYRYGLYAYGWQDCYAGMTTEQLEASFIETGITDKNDQVYELEAQKYPEVYKCLYEKTKRYIWDETKQEGKYVETVSYNNFTPSHPMFFWRHPYGDLIAFVRSDVVPAAEKAKPVIYLYPENTERVKLKISPIGGFTETIPEYENGWDVEATPDGVITNIKDGNKYPYLFWEGGKEGTVVTPEEGFVVAKENIQSTLENKLSDFGLNKKEREDFIEFWSSRLSRAPYYFITFISREEIDRVAPISVFPKPDTVIRVLMDYKPLTEMISVEPLTITKTKRKGFTLVEWGGIVRD